MKNRDNNSKSGLINLKDGKGIKDKNISKMEQYSIVPSQQKSTTLLNITDWVTLKEYNIYLQVIKYFTKLACKKNSTLKELRQFSKIDKISKNDSLSNIEMINKTVKHHKEELLKVGCNEEVILKLHSSTEDLKRLAS